MVRLILNQFIPTANIEPNAAKSIGYYTVQKNELRHTAKTTKKVLTQQKWIVLKWQVSQPISSQCISETKPKVERPANKQ